MTKRKEERRKLLKEDEILSRMERAARYIQQNPVQVFSGFAVALLVVAIYSAWQSFDRGDRDVQAAAVYAIQKILETDLEAIDETPAYASEREKYEAALAEAEKALEEVTGIFRFQALSYKIECLVFLGRQDEAKPIYTEMMDKGPGTTKLIGLMGLGDIALADGDFDTAINYYQQIETEGGDFYAELVSYKRALALREKGDEEGARNEVSTLVEKYEGEEAGERPPIFFKAKELLDELDTGEEEAES